MISVLFVHGMGRSPFSGSLMLHKLRKAGLKTQTFSYSASIEDFESMNQRLTQQIIQMANAGDYLVIGHSLGGVLLRSVLNSLPEGTKRPQQVFLLGSPMHPSRLATLLKDNIIYRVLFGDCGQLLGSKHRMSAIGSLTLPTTSIVGVRGIKFKWSPFGKEQNDGVVSISEVSADWIPDPILVPVIHTLLPFSDRVIEIILQAIERKHCNYF